MPADDRGGKKVFHRSLVLFHGLFSLLSLNGLKANNSDRFKVLYMKEMNSK